MKANYLILLVIVLFVACNKKVNAPKLESFLKSENIKIPGYKILILSATDCSSCIINKLKKHFASNEYNAAVIIDNPYMSNNSVNGSFLSP